MPARPWRTSGDHGYHRAMSPSRRPRPRRRPAPTPIRPRRRRQRAGHRGRLVVLLLAVVVLVAAGIAGATAVMTFAPRCDLAALHPVKIGQNTFVYAADGSLLGSIPAERNRQVVPLARMSRWLPLATVAIEDRRFYSHGGIDAEGIARALWRDLNAGRVVEGGSTITQQLVRTLYISNERTVERKVTEACLAVKLDRKWSKERILATLPQLGLLRQPRVRRRGGGAHVLLALGEPAHALPGGAARGADEGAVGVRPVRRPCPGGRAPERGAARDAPGADDHAEAVRGARAGAAPPGFIPGTSTRRSASRTSSATCATSSCGRTARRPFARAVCASTRRSSRACSASRTRRSRGR